MSHSCKGSFLGFHVIFLAAILKYPTLSTGPQSDEVTEGHAEAARGLADKVTFPLQGFLFGGKATLLLVDGLARPVRHADLGHPATGVAVFC